MLKYRLIFGPLMIIGAFVVFYLDSMLDTYALPENLRPLFSGQHAPIPGLLLLAVGIVIALLAVKELCAIAEAKGISAHGWIIALGTIASLITVYLTPLNMYGPFTISVFASILVFCFIATMIWHTRNKVIDGVIASAGATLLGVLYLGILLGFMIAIRRWHSAWMLIAVIMMTKSCDIGGYTFGRLFGKHKLIPWLSSGKTWEGLVGGVFLSALAGLGFIWLTKNTDLFQTYEAVPDQPEMLQLVKFHYSYVDGLIMAIAFGLVGQVGDLTASAFKRDAGIKDSGNTIPGFGGLLDVLDSPLLVAPIAYWLLYLLAEKTIDPMMITIP